ncbi:MAG: TonB-dependent receptor plug domain-containing protein, partial [Pseudomonadota bacterium]|nr:TonB-dependent receptor plug domain-containing protein [Pseudomonadota bacterium]
MRTHKIATLALAVSAAFSSSVLAQEAATTEKKEASLEQITVTAQKRTQSIQEVPISVATLSGEKFESLFSGGEDILALAVRVPGLYAESSNGRVAPRFYIRGLGNTDFDLAASQPVSIIMDEVVMENVVLKSFPLFDVQQVEVLRGPQGTLFGRNTTAGIIKFDTVKPTQDLEGYAKAGFGSYGTMNFEGAISGGLTDELSARLSLLSQERDDYIDNAFTGENDAIGGYDEKAYRLQLLWEPSADFSALLNVHGRELEGTASIFRANVFDKGSNELNANYDRETVYYDGDLQGDGIDNNPQEYDGFGASLKLEYDMDEVTFTSISALETADGSSLGDVDGGFNLADGTSGPGFIPFSAVTQDNLDDLE